MNPYGYEDDRYTATPIDLQGSAPRFAGSDRFRKTYSELNKTAESAVTGALRAKADIANAGLNVVAPTPNTGYDTATGILGSIGNIAKGISGFSGLFGSSGSSSSSGGLTPASLDLIDKYSQPLPGIG